IIARLFIGIGKTQQLADVLDAEARGLRRPNEAQTLKRRRIILAVIALAARAGPEDAGSLVISNRGSRNGRDPGQLADCVSGHEEILCHRRNSAIDYRAKVRFLRQRHRPIPVSPTAPAGSDAGSGTEGGLITSLPETSVILLPEL